MPRAVWERACQTNRGLLPSRCGGYSRGRVEDNIEAARERKERAFERAAEVLAISAALAEAHARRAEAGGDHERAELERARASKAHDAVARARRLASGS